MLNFTTLKNRSARGTLTGIAWFLAGCLLTPTAAGAAEYYVAPNGSSTNDGSVSRPLDLATALSASSPARPGDTIWLRDGRYLGTFVSDLEGSTTAPIVVRQYPGERAVIDAVTGDRTHSRALRAWVGHVVLGLRSHRLESGSDSNRRVQSAAGDVSVGTRPPHQIHQHDRA